MQAGPCGAGSRYLIAEQHDDAFEVVARFDRRELELDMHGTAGRENARDPLRAEAASGG